MTILNGLTPLYSMASAPFVVTKRRRLRRPVDPMSSAGFALSASVNWSTDVRSTFPLMSGERIRAQFVPGDPPAVVLIHNDSLPTSVRMAREPRGAEIVATGVASVT